MEKKLPSTPSRPTLLLSTNNTQSTNVRHHFNIDSICLSPSTPTEVQQQPRLFQPGTLFDANTYERIRSTVYDQSNKIKIKNKEEEEDDNEDSDQEQTLDDRLHEARASQIQRLSQSIIHERPEGDNDVADTLMDLLGLVNNRSTITDMNVNQTSTFTIAAAAASHPYPPINQTGQVAEHDRPYADYGHLSAQEIAEEYQFNNLLNQEEVNTTDIEPTSSRGKKRLSTKTFAITSWSDVSKETVMDEIKRQFGIEHIQYICIAKEVSPTTNKIHLHIQIILKDKAKKTTGFLDRITNTHCNYQVTDNDRAWNEYIKKGGDFIEFGTFKSTTKRAAQFWPSQSSSASGTSNIVPLRSIITTTDDPLPPPPTTMMTTPMMTTTAVRGGRAAEEKQHQRNEIATQAMAIAETNIDDALEFMRKKRPDDFLKYYQWYKNAFTYVHIRKQEETTRMKQSHRIVYRWPESFPDCTPALRDVVDRWYREEFTRESRAKCLILIGPTGTGKTSFAKSLPGHYNYFKGRWRMKSWKDSADYSIFDDIDWDEFENLGFPSKKDLFTQNGITMASDKYEKPREIDITQPAIILFNPGRSEGALGRIPRTVDEQHEAEFWQHRSIIFRMGSNEYFHKPDYYRDNNVNSTRNNPPSTNTIQPHVGASPNILDEQLIERSSQH